MLKNKLFLVIALVASIFILSSCLEEDPPPQETILELDGTTWVASGKYTIEGNTFDAEMEILFQDNVGLEYTLKEKIIMGENTDTQTTRGVVRNFNPHIERSTIQLWCDFSDPLMEDRSSLTLNNIAKGEISKEQMSLEFVQYGGQTFVFKQK